MLGLARNQQTIQQTLQSLNSAATDTSLASISGLGLPEVRELKHEISEIFPASNLPGFLLQGLLQMKGRALDDERVAGDLRVLFRETRQIGLYGTFLAAPAMIIYGYQRLLTLAGKDIDSAFPHGTWQFYTEFGLREDAARHCVETNGFSKVASGLNDVDKAVCWVAAAMQVIVEYDDLLANEWHERVAMRCVDLALGEAAQIGLGRRLPRKAEERAQMIGEATEHLRSAYKLENLAGDWASQRPYAGPLGAPLDGYAPARRRSFVSYLDRRLRSVPGELRVRAEMLLAERKQADLSAYQAQMSMLQTLRADNYSDRRDPLAIPNLCVAFVSGGVYHLIDLWERDEQGNLMITPRNGDPTRPGQSVPLTATAAGEMVDRYGQPVSFDRRGELRVAGMHIGRLRRLPLSQIRSQIAAAMRTNHPLHQNEPRNAQATDMLLAGAMRGRQEPLRNLLSATTRSEFEALRRAPIIVNWEQHRAAQPLSHIRRSSRGSGDHAMTIIRSEDRTIFDMSHIFFDGIWGAMLAEITTGFASALAEQVRQSRPERTRMPRQLELAANPAFLRAAHAEGVQAIGEVQAESDAVSLNAVSSLRRRLAERKMYLTVNDVLLLARYEHAASYQPGPVAMAALDDLATRGGEAAELHAKIMRDLDEQRALVPSLLIPMDASWIDPRQRLHPATLRNPQPDLLPLLARCDSQLRTLAKSPTAQLLHSFEEDRKNLWKELTRFSALMRALREITTRGDSFATAALKLMGFLPKPMQSLLDMIPQKIDLLNEIVKGAEVFSNIGQVPRTSSVTRFSSSRDDGDTKLLVWGIMTDANGRMVITLRDFRPHVDLLLRAGHTALAELLVADFLESYTTGINQLVKRLQRVLAYK